MIAALYVQPRGCYYGLDGVDPWGEDRDARLYEGPHAVVAHPPCERWSRFWSGGPSSKIRKEKGDDGGCFASALSVVRRWGGILEHPEGSHAWPAFGLAKPPRMGSWIPAGDELGFTCCVEQAWYGHQGRKRTWLYGVSRNPLPELRWGPAPGDFSRPDLDADAHLRGRRASRQGVVGRLSHRQRAATPIEFRDLLISIAEGCCPQGQPPK